MRHDITQGYARGSGKYQSYDSLLPTLAQATREVTEYAAAKGVVTMTENHGFFSQDSERVEKLYTAVGHPNFGLLCDMGNFLCADEDPAQAVARLGPLRQVRPRQGFHRKALLQRRPRRGRLPHPGAAISCGGLSSAMAMCR